MLTSEKPLCSFVQLGGYQTQYLDFPASHWKRLRTNNLQERTNREIKRRSRVVQVFPSVRSLERLAGAVMCEQDEAWSEAR